MSKSLLQRIEDNKHIVSIKVWLERKGKKLVEYSLSINITDIDINQHYVEGMMKSADDFGQTCGNKFKEKPAIQKRLPNLPTFL